MEVNIYEAKTNLSKLIQSLVDQNEETINICKNGVPVVKMTLIKKPSKRIGIAKGKIKSISVDELNSYDVGEYFKL